MFYIVYKVKEMPISLQLDARLQNVVFLMHKWAVLKIKIELFQHFPWSRHIWKVRIHDKWL